MIYEMAVLIVDRDLVLPYPAVTRRVFYIMQSSLCKYSTNVGVGVTSPPWNDGWMAWPGLSTLAGSQQLLKQLANHNLVKSSTYFGLINF